MSDELVRGARGKRYHIQMGLSSEQVQKSGRLFTHGMAFSIAAPMRRASVSSQRRATIWIAVGNPWVNPEGTDRTGHCAM